jgi:hypothetical protein
VAQYAPANVASLAAKLSLCKLPRISLKCLSTGCSNLPPSCPLPRPYAPSFSSLAHSQMRIVFCTLTLNLLLSPWQPLILFDRRPKAWPQWLRFGVVGPHSPLGGAPPLVRDPHSTSSLLEVRPPWSRSHKPQSHLQGAPSLPWAPHSTQREICCKPKPKAEINNVDLG